MSENDNESHDWKHLAEAARDETDPKKLMELIEQLNRALDEARERFVSGTHRSGELAGRIPRFYSVLFVNSPLLIFSQD